MKIFVLSALALATYVSATCDGDVTLANAINLTQACTNDIQGGTPPTIATVLSDWHSNSNSVYQFGICGSTNCLSQFYELQQSYTTCTPTSSVTSYSATIQALNTTCDNVTSTVGNYSGTCNTAAYADIYWAKNVATLSTDCASALTNFSYTTSSNWYSVVQAITLTSNNLSAAFCGSAACVNLTTDNKAWLPNCTSSTGDDLHNTTTNLLTYCHHVNNPTTTVAPNTTEAPSNTTVAPSNSTVAPSNSTVAPSNSTVAPSNSTVAPSNTTTAAPSNTTAAPSNSTSGPTPTPASTTPASNSSNATTTAAPDTITVGPSTATPTAAPSATTTTVAPATVAPATVAPATATPTPTPTQSSASTISGLFAVALVAAVLA